MTNEEIEAQIDAMVDPHVAEVFGKHLTRACFDARCSECSGITFEPIFRCACRCHSQRRWGRR